MSRTQRRKNVPVSEARLRYHPDGFKDTEWALRRIQRDFGHSDVDKAVKASISIFYSDSGQGFYKDLRLPWVYRHKYEERFRAKCKAALYRAVQEDDSGSEYVSLRGVRNRAYWDYF